MGVGFTTIGYLIVLKQQNSVKTKFEIESHKLNEFGVEYSVLVDAIKTILETPNKVKVIRFVI